MKKLLKLFPVLLILVLTLSGCGNKSVDSNTEIDETNQTASGIVELTVWAEEDNFELLNILIDNFKEANKGVKFDIKLVSQNDGDVRNIILDDVTQGPDVFHFPDDQLNSLIAGGVLSAVPNADTVKTANNEGSIGAASLNDTLYAYPITADNGYFLYYNKKYLTEEDVKSFDRILEVANQHGKKVDMEITSGWYLYSFFSGAGLTVGLNEDGITNNCNWNTTEGKYKGIDVAKSIQDIVNNPGFLVGDGSFPDKAKSDEVIAGINGVWNAINIKEAWGEDYGACKLPTFTCNGDQVQMNSFTGFKMIGVSRYSKNLEWAHKLADYLSNEDAQLLRFSMRNQGPSNINASQSDEILKVPAIQAVLAQSEYGTLQRIGNNYWGPCTDFVNALINKTSETNDMQKFLDKITERITASVAQ